MATVRYTGKVEENGCLTIPRETIEEPGIRPGDALDVTLHPPHPTESAANNGEAVDQKTLADLLGDYIGAVEGNGESTRDAGRQFTDYLVQKHREGRL